MLLLCLVVGLCSRQCLSDANLCMTYCKDCEAILFASCTRLYYIQVDWLLWYYTVIFDMVDSKASYWNKDRATLRDQFEPLRFLTRPSEPTPSQP